jgi:hypothetical protein
VKLLVITQELHVCATALKTLLELDLILHNEGLALVVDLGGEFGRDSMMSSRILHHETLVARDAGENLGLFNRPLSNICPVLFSLGVLLLRMGWRPSRIPIISELFEEGGFQVRRLEIVSAVISKGADTYCEGRSLCGTRE